MTRSRERLDTPMLGKRKSLVPRIDRERFGRASETFARALGTGGFLIGLTIFCIIWLAWNSWAPAEWSFDPRVTNFTLLTLLLSLQASYAAPLILLAQNRQDDRDRVKTEQDRQRAERNLADTEYLAREVVALRLAMEEVATKEFVKDELRETLEELLAELRNQTKPGDKTE
ncbi:MAG: DUF1003 domain-containing protein [Micrococcales bacterium]|nr:DUF1003 domain-containing protein [Actinomycetota bacterium]NCA07396.1 DUF1003 domain-containing protein [Micrococcales bacterium]